MKKLDVAIVGGGPAGLAVAIHASRRGLSTAVFERQTWPVDKACGEGLLTPGLVELEALGARQYLTPEDCSPIVGIRYLQEDGTQVEAHLPAPGGLGIRRLGLARALERAARESGAELKPQCHVQSVDRQPNEVLLTTAAGEQYSASFLVAADGLNSPLRQAQGLDGPKEPAENRRLRAPPTLPHGAVDGLRGGPLRPRRGGLHHPSWPRSRGSGLPLGRQPAGGKISFPNLLRQFPQLEQRLAGVPEDSRARGAGPLLRNVRHRTLDRFALVGDAAGYVDAITGEGLTLALRSAAVLGGLLPDALARGANRDSLLPYERAAQSAFRRYAFFTNMLLTLSRFPRARHHVLHAMARYPITFRKVLHWVVGG